MPEQSPFTGSYLHTDGTGSGPGIWTDPEPQVSHGVQKSRSLTLVPRPHPGDIREGQSHLPGTEIGLRTLADPLRSLLMGGAPKSTDEINQHRLDHGGLELLSSYPSLLFGLRFRGSYAVFEFQKTSDPIRGLSPRRKMATRV